MKDQIVAEIRQIRRDIDKEYGNDPKKYQAHLRTAQKRLGPRLIRLRPKPLKRQKVA